MVVDEDDEIILINSDGIVIRIRASEVSNLGRATQGVKIMRVDDDANIVALAKVIKEDEIDEKPLKNKEEKKQNGGESQQITL